MKTIVKTGWIVVAIAAVAYVGTSYYAGQAIQNEVARYQQALAPHNEIYVRALQYEPGIFSGTLTYDLAWRPVAGNPWREVLAELSGDDVTELRLAGTVPMTQGLFTSGMNWARAREQLALPESVRPWLPQYPGQTPWLTVEAVVDLSRQLTLDVSVIDYNGRLVDPGSGFLFDAVIAGVKARLLVPEGATQADFSAQVERMSVSDEQTQLGLQDFAAQLRYTLAAQPLAQGAVSLQSLKFEDKSETPVKAEIKPLHSQFDLKQEWSSLWTGSTQLVLEGVDILAPEGSMQIGKSTLSTSVAREQDKVQGHLQVAIDQWGVAGLDLPKLTLETSYRDFHGEALNTVLSLADKVAEDDALSAAELQVFEDAVKRVLAGGPKVSLDQLALSVVAPNDVRMSVAAGLASGTALPESDEAWAQFGQSLALSSKAYVSLAALEPLLSRMLALQALEEGKQALDPAQFADEAKSLIEAFLPQLADQPYWLLDQESLQFEAQLQDGKITFHGKEVEELSRVEDLLLLGALLLGGAFDTTESVVPNLAAAPAFGRLSLEADFEPDPQRVRITTGGPDQLSGELGDDCVGYIDASRPDVEVEYEAGEFSLYFSVNSQVDTVLVVALPDGSWACNDDGFADSLNPLVPVLEPESGIYRVWVASFESEPARAILEVSEID